MVSSTIADRIGLLVFEEIPGWQHIGGEEWKTGGDPETSAA
jgi:beta-galactosidase/beta-glucuronidase